MDPDDGMTALESGFLWMETADQPLHVGCVLLLGGQPPSVEELREQMTARIVEMPRLRSTVERSRYDLTRPRWSEQPSLDLTHHVQAAAPVEGDRRGLRILVAALMSAPLDPERPLWQVWLVPNAPDGRWALVVKAHHALVDGESGADLLGCLLDRVAGPEPLAGAASTKAAASSRPTLSDLRRGLRTLVRPDLPPSVLNGPLGSDRDWDWLAVERAALEEAARRLDCTVNDLFLAVLAGALRQVLLASGQPIDSVVVRTIVPVSQRQSEGETRLGTVASAMFVELPVHESDVRARLGLIAARTGEQKAGSVATGTRAVVRAGNAIPAPLLARAAAAYVRRGQRRVNAAATNVRGMEGSFTLMGRALHQVVPWIPIALNVRITAALLSFGISSCISVTTDSGTVPDAAALIEVMRAELAALMAG